MKKITVITTLVGFLGFYGEESQGAQQNNRALTRTSGIKAIIARGIEMDPCSSRNVAENINAFWACVKNKLSAYTTTGSNGVPQWNLSKIWATSNGSIVTTTVPTMVMNRSLFNQWKSLFEQYKKISNSNDQLIKQLDSIAEAEEADSPSKDYTKLQQQQLAILVQLNSMVQSWSAFIANNQRYFTAANVVAPTSLYPTPPDPRSPVFLTQSTRPGVYMIDEGFYSDFRNLLDQNPNMHLQLMKYYLISRPANFRSLTSGQLTDVAANKMFTISMWCADPQSVEGALLSMAAGASAPLAFLPLDACQFNAARVTKGDGSAINTGGGNGYA